MAASRRARHDILFEPIEIRSKVFRNRFYSVPHALFVPGRRMSEIGFRRMKAEGGWAAVCGGIISIRPTNWGGHAPRIWDETDRAVLGRVATEIRGQGALAGIELGHSGGLSMGEKFAPPDGASQVAYPEQLHAVPRAMSVDEIHAVQDDWVTAGRAAADIGYEIVYAYGSHGYLPAQFLSPYFNTRTDEYGGSLENRARFWLEIIERLRNEVGDRCLVAARLTAEAFSPYGAELEDTLGFVRLADDLVDLWDVNVGFQWAPDSAPARFQPEGYQVEWSGRIREATKKPIVGVARLTDPDRMAEIIESGVWDFIGGARPGIADPFLPTKIEQGRYDEIRECTGSNFCIAFEVRTPGLSCVQNPTIGEEYRRGWHPEHYPRPEDPELDILVVGAGPAGMECARVLGARGFRRVHLVEAEREIGGHLNWLSRLPGLGDWARITHYRKIQLARLANVEIVSSLKLDADAVLDYGADIVVTATGSSWAGPDASWLRLPLQEIADSGVEILTPEEIMVGGREPRDGRVVVWDGDGSSVAVGLAERLATAGREVSLVTRFGVVAPLLDWSFEGSGVRSKLHELGVAMLPGMVPVRAGSEGIVLVGRLRHGVGAPGGLARSRRPARVRGCPLPRARRAAGRPRACGHPRRVPRRRLRRAAPPRLRRRGRPSTRARDRLRRSERAAAAARGVRHRGRRHLVQPPARRIPVAAAATPRRRHMSYVETASIEEEAAGLRESHEAGFALPAHWYTNRAYFERERDLVLRRSWQFAAHTAQLENSGDQLVTTIAGVPVVLLRDEDRELRGFVNICRHRAHPVVFESGNRKTLQCLYHGWTYNLDGCLRRAPRAELELDFDKSQFGLAPVQVAVWGPMVWVNVDAGAPSRSASGSAACRSSSASAASTSRRSRSPSSARGRSTRTGRSSSTTQTSATTARRAIPACRTPSTWTWRTRSS